MKYFGCMAWTGLLMAGWAATLTGALAGVENNVKYGAGAVVDVVASGHLLVNGYRGFLKFIYTSTGSIDRVQYWHNLRDGAFRPNTGLSRHDSKKPFYKYKDYSVKDFQSGMTLIWVGDRRYLQLTAPTFAADGGGEVQLEFMRDDTKNDARELNLEVSRDPSTKDLIVETNGQFRKKFNGLSISIGTSWGIPHGVDELKLFNNSKALELIDADNLPKVKMN